MTTAIIFSGARFSRTVDINEIEKIKNAKYIFEIDSLWERIANLFFRTQKQKIKRKLFDITYRNNINTKTNNFYKLQSISYFCHKENFFYCAEKVSKEETKINLMIKNKDRLIFYSRQLIKI
ncbi:MAG: hypothetical protein ACSLEN_04005 [Candidatus Malihini olakiniferum]